jgi:peptidoglycan-associated lipoprotein
MIAVANQSTGDIALTYHWLRTNAQPGGCGCFDLNGGGISGSWNVRPELAVVTEFSAEYAGQVPSTGNSLTLTSYLAGMRYVLPQLWSRGRHGLQPFTQLLVGAAHAGGGMAGAGDATFAFATRIGGGADLPVSPSFAVRIIQIDYDLTTFHNSLNGHQNNLLLSSGVVFRWSHNK